MYRQLPVPFQKGRRKNIHIQINNITTIFGAFRKHTKEQDGKVQAYTVCTSDKLLMFEYYSYHSVYIK